MYVLTFNKPDTDPDLEVAGLMTASAPKEDQVHLELLTKPNYFELLRYSARPYALDMPITPLSYLHHFTATIPSCYIHHIRILLLYVTPFRLRFTSQMYVMPPCYLQDAPLPSFTLRCTS